ncbi:MAG: signal peptidase I [Anaerovibrio sp.]|jgi:signal peptidase I|uniref:Signal peptidase I n=2 Tax=Anaerovibrio lipolyticus TaxID=82374 RepID=A0A0B2JUQ7_9FIRM|nr:MULTISPECIES: signal peptidase I [Anaerovibrio]KHM52080.1 signal peptidase I [Anaerovibrio lipolyticus]MBO5588558.1 signal peptidase I [Anaerovibrio sp.]MBO6245014.1 signal peptidase I [Anaerovibrio sp.]MBQ1856394.1 signal peptidase I [Anaerovibrio sp.]MBR1697062.1 signal peptidase I [Anaerovibrio sp.]
MGQLGTEIRDWVISIAVAVALAMFIRTFVVELYLVDGPSMMPTLEHQQRLVVNKFIYKMRAPERGEILIFQYPRDKSRDFIKRVIAVPGDTIEIKDHNVYVNGELQNEDYILAKSRMDYPKTTIPEGHVFVMGDNRNNSEDSRFPDVGFVPYELLKGKAMLVFWPLSAWKTLP